MFLIYEAEYHKRMESIARHLQEKFLQHLYNSPSFQEFVVEMGNVEANWDKNFEKQLPKDETEDKDRPKCQCPMEALNEPLKDGKCPKCGGL